MQEKLAFAHLLRFPSRFLSPVYHTQTPYCALSDTSRIRTCIYHLIPSHTSNVFFVDWRWFCSKHCPRRFMPEEGEAARFVLDAQGCHVACATGCEIRLAFVKGSPEKSFRISSVHIHYPANSLILERLLERVNALTSKHAPWDPAEIRITLSSACVH